MKRSLSILMILFVLFGSTREGMRYLFFKLNQNWIASELCINSDQPEKKCRGACYLKKQIQKANDEQKQSPLLLNQVELPFLAYFPDGEETAPIKKLNEKRAWALISVNLPESVTLQVPEEPPEEA